MSAAVAATGCLAFALPAASQASQVTWGPDLSAPVSLDTANGDHTAGPGQSSPSPAIGPFPHNAEDVGVWNDGNRAPSGGQVLQINVKGCAVEDKSAPTQQSTDVHSGVTLDVNTILFQTLAPSGDNWTATATSGQFKLPFCSDSNSPDTGQPVNTSTVNHYQPVHMCIAPGDQVALHDIGGFIPDHTDNKSGGPWYTQGIPLAVLASTGDTVHSFVGTGLSTYGPGLFGTEDTSKASQDKAGYRANAGEQVQLQVVEGVGDDAYGQCPGGNAVEPQNGNNVLCVTRSTAPTDPYGTCNASQRPVRPPQNTGAPTISVSSNGTAVSGAPVPGNRMDATPGAWTQDSNQSFISYAYQWEDCDSSGANCAPIGGQAGKNPYYYATTNDVGHSIAVAVSASNNANTEGPASSAPTAAVASPNVPVITTLKLNPSTWNESKSTVITYYDTDPATTTVQILQNGVVVRTITNSDRAKLYGGNGINLIGLKAGSYQLRITPNNKGTVGQILTLSFTVTSATPVITGLRVNPSSFNWARGGTVTYTDSQSGNAVLNAVQCKQRKKGVCTKFKTFKTIRHHDRAGPNGVKLTGLAAGHYQLQIVSTYAGRRSTALLTPFTAKLVHGKRHHTRHRVRHPASDVGAAVASVFG